MVPIPPKEVSFFVFVSHLERAVDVLPFAALVPAPLLIQATGLSTKAAGSFASFHHIIRILGAFSATTTRNKGGKGESAQISNH